MRRKPFATREILKAVNPQRVIFLVWSDASAEDTGTQLKREEMQAGCVMQAAGIFVGESETHLSFAADYYNEDGRFRGIHHIPKVNVIGQPLIWQPALQRHARGKGGCTSSRTSRNLSTRRDDVQGRKASR